MHSEFYLLPSKLFKGDGLNLRHGGPRVPDHQQGQAGQAAEGSVNLLQHGLQQRRRDQQRGVHTILPSHQQASLKGGTNICSTNIRKSEVSLEL